MDTSIRAILIMIAAALTATVLILMFSPSRDISVDTDATETDVNTDILIPVYLGVDEEDWRFLDIVDNNYISPDLVNGSEDFTKPDNVGSCITKLTLSYKDAHEDATIGSITGLKCSGLIATKYIRKSELLYIMNPIDITNKTVLLKNIITSITITYVK